MKIYPNAVYCENWDWEVSAVGPKCVIWLAGEDDVVLGAFYNAGPDRARLAAAGFETQESRVAARKRMRNP